jgi:hypothetical protein
MTDLVEIGLILNFFTNFVIINLGPGPDWIRTQQQAGFGSNIPGSDQESGLSEYGSETLQKPSHFFKPKSQGSLSAFNLMFLTEGNIGPDPCSLTLG